jgi:hypothetical protein
MRRAAFLLSSPYIGGVEVSTVPEKSTRSIKPLFFCVVSILLHASTFASLFILFSVYLLLCPADTVIMQQL